MSPPLLYLLDITAEVIISVLLCVESSNTSKLPKWKVSNVYIPCLCVVSNGSELIRSTVCTILLISLSRFIILVLVP